MLLLTGWLHSIQHWLAYTGHNGMQPWLTLGFEAAKLKIYHATGLAFPVSLVFAVHAGRRGTRNKKPFSPTVTHPNRLKYSAVSAQASDHSSGCGASTLEHLQQTVRI